MNALESASNLFPRRGRLAGLDYGSVRIGIALCDPDWRIASPHQVYHRRTLTEDGKFFQAFAQAEGLVGWVVGLPVHMSGDEGGKAQEARRFGAWLQELTSLPVSFQDERFTSAEADHLLAEGGQKRRRATGRRDMLAAQVILARFLETGVPSPPTDWRDGSR